MSIDCSSGIAWPPTSIGTLIATQTNGREPRGRPREWVNVGATFPAQYNCGVRPTTSTRLIIGVWAIGFVVGTITHTIDLVTGGFNVYAGFPEPVRWFWISLTVIDPLVVILLIRRSRATAPLGVLVMIADLAVNWTVFFTVGGLSLVGVLTQSIFGAFVFVTAAHVWRKLRR